MLFYVGKAASTPELSSPTFVMLTDRIDLDDQLYRTFAASGTLRKRTKQEKPQTADDAGKLRELLNSPKSNGGVVFATLQKFRLTEDERKAGCPASADLAAP